MTPSYAGFHQAARAACEAARRPELMLSLSKWLYPLVAREMNTTGAAVERNIRTVILRAWRRNPELLRQCAGFPLSKRPTCGEFLALLAACLEEETAGHEKSRTPRVRLWHYSFSMSIIRPTRRAWRPPSNWVFRNTSTMRSAMLGPMIPAPMASMLASLWRRVISAE